MSRLYVHTFFCKSASTHAAEQRPVPSRNRHMFMKARMKGRDKKATGNEVAIMRQIKDATIVVIIAPRIPELKSSCKPSDTPKTFSSFSSRTIEVKRATMNMHKVTQIWRPIKKDRRLSPSKASSQFDFATSLMVSSGILITAKSATCIPSKTPTVAMRKKNNAIETYGDRPSHAAVFPSRRALRMTMKL